MSNNESINNGNHQHRNHLVEQMNRMDGENENKEYIHKICGK
jgi:hypothetical protein